MDFDSVERALQDCYGLYVNIDGKGTHTIQLILGVRR